MFGFIHMFKIKHMYDFIHTFCGEVVGYTTIVLNNRFRWVGIAALKIEKKKNLYQREKNYNMH
jgi:hypothetical protein